MTLTLDAAITARSAYIARHDVTPLALPLAVNLQDYQRFVCDLYVHSEEDVTSYHAFASELLAQWDALLASGVRVEFCDDDPTPISAETGRISFRAFVDDVKRTNVLRVFRSGGDHSYLDAETVMHNGRAETLNSIFRAVHDFFGHLASGGHFGWRGETQAYYSHAAMFSVRARAALFCETVGQQCYYAVHNDYAPQRCVNMDASLFSPPLA